jgi:hypothetical protein
MSQIGSLRLHLRGSPYEPHLLLAVCLRHSFESCNSNHCNISTLLLLQVRGRQAANQAATNLKRSGKQVYRGES